MLPEKFKAIIKQKYIEKKKSIHTFNLSFCIWTPLLDFLFSNILLNSFYENGLPSNQLSYSFSSVMFSFPLPSLSYSFSSKNEAVEINYKAWNRKKKYIFWKKYKYRNMFYWVKQTFLEK